MGSPRFFSLAISSDADHAGPTAKFSRRLWTVVAGAFPGHEQSCSESLTGRTEKPLLLQLVGE